MHAQLHFGDIWRKALAVMWGEASSRRERGSFEPNILRNCIYVVPIVNAAINLILKACDGFFFLLFLYTTITTIIFFFIFFYVERKLGKVSRPPHTPSPPSSSSSFSSSILEKNHCMHTNYKLLHSNITANATEKLNSTQIFDF